MKEPNKKEALKSILENPIIKGISPYGWFIASKKPSMYLHYDGNLRKSTLRITQDQWEDAAFNKPVAPHYAYWPTEEAAKTFYNNWKKEMTNV